MTSTLKQQDLKYEIEEGVGYTTLTLEKSEHELICLMVRDCFLLRIQYDQPDLLKEFYSIDLADYHNYSHLIDHANMWQNQVRIFPSLFVENMRELPFFKTLQQTFGEMPLATFSCGCQEEVWYRLVRPNQKNDVGALHADEWFWTCNNVSALKGYKRAKVWIALNMPDPSIGLHVVPNSHKREWNYTTSCNANLKATTTQIKPAFNDSIDGYELICPIRKEGELILFHDKLLHQGMPNMSDETRLSLEFTIYYK